MQRAQDWETIMASVIRLIHRLGAMLCLATVGCRNSVQIEVVMLSYEMIYLEPEKIFHVASRNTSSHLSSPGASKSSLMRQMAWQYSKQSEELSCEDFVKGFS